MKLATRTVHGGSGRFHDVLSSPENPNGDHDLEKHRVSPSHGQFLGKRNQENHPALSPELLGQMLREPDAIDTIHEQARIAMLVV
jgi:hypothetical protein